MNAIRQSALIVSHWIDEVASAISSIAVAFRATRRFEIVEQDNSAFALTALGRRRATPLREAALRFEEGKFFGDEGTRVHTIFAGSQIELVLARRRFVFRVLELPHQASGFLEAIVRSQIDRLTPWPAAQAVFGCGPPNVGPNGRINIVVAATARSAVMPLVTAFETFRPRSIIVSVPSALPGGESNSNRTIVLSHDTNRAWSLIRLRRFLIGAPIAMALVAVGALAASMFVSSDLEDSQLRISQLMAERRAAISGAGASIGEQGVAKLAQQKRESSATVIVLEQLSNVLPDDTYLTEMRVADGKLQIVGVTREAAALIQIMEQTEQFKNATFFAPTTRAPSGNGEQFHIEAKIVPYFPAPL